MIIFGDCSFGANWHELKFLPESRYLVKTLVTSLISLFQGCINLPSYIQIVIAQEYRSHTLDTPLLQSISSFISANLSSNLSTISACPASAMSTSSSRPSSDIFRCVFLPSFVQGLISLLENLHKWQSIYSPILAFSLRSTWQPLQFLQAWSCNIPSSCLHWIRPPWSPWWILAAGPLVGLQQCLSSAQGYGCEPLRFRVTGSLVGGWHILLKASALAWSTSRSFWIPMFFRVGFPLPSSSTVSAISAFLSWLLTLRIWSVNLFTGKRDFTLIQCGLNPHELVLFLPLQTTSQCSSLPSLCSGRFELTILCCSLNFHSPSGCDLMISLPLEQSFFCLFCLDSVWIHPFDSTPSL